MPTSSFSPVNKLTEDVGTEVHNFASDTFKIALSNTAPNAATMAVLADIGEITPGNGYSAGGNEVPTTTYVAEVDGSSTFDGGDVVFTPVTGAIADFRYAWLYNSTPVGGPLIGWYDNGAAVTGLSDPSTFTVQIQTNILQVTSTGA